jgi:uncharacterized alkaline shock family protein YloU
MDKRPKVLETNTSTNYRGLGNTTIAPEVLLTITQLTTLGVPGVSRMSPLPGSVGRLLHHKVTGVHLQIEENYVTADLYLILINDVNIREVSQKVQAQVARAIIETVGMQVDQINIHVEDIDFPSEAEV